MSSDGPAKRGVIGHTGGKTTSAADPDPVPGQQAGPGHGYILVAPTDWPGPDRPTPSGSAVRTRPIKPLEAQHALRFRDATIVGIKVRPNYVEFDFVGRLGRGLLRISKAFSCVVAGRGAGSFDPNFRFDGGSRDGNGDFLFLRGAHCSDVSLTQSGLALRFTDTSSIHVAFVEADFEPIEMLGFTGPGLKDMDFYHVL